jgi:hypothetical protein
MDFDDCYERDAPEEDSATGSDELLSDDDLRLPESAHMLVRIHAVQAWLARRIETAKLEIGEAALALQEASTRETPSSSGRLARRHEREAQVEHIQRLQKDINDAQERLLAYEEADLLLQEALAHASGERALVEFYLTLDDLAHEERQREEIEPSPSITAPRLAVLADVQQRIERVGIPYEEE